VYLDVRHLGTLFLRSSYHLLFKNVSHHGSFQSVSKCLNLLPTKPTIKECGKMYLCICIFVCLYVCIWMWDTCEHCFCCPRTICFSKIYHIMVLFKVFQSVLFCYPPTIKECGKLYLCICVFVCVYLDVRHFRTLFLRSSYHLFFKNISHHGSFKGVTKCLILLPTNHKRGIKKGQNQGKERHLSGIFFGFFLYYVNLHQKSPAPIYIWQKAFREPV